AHAVEHVPERPGLRDAGREPVLRSLSQEGRERPRQQQHARARRQRPGRQRYGSGMRTRSPGQVMVLGVVTMLILAFSLMLSFNMTQAIHERIRIQQHSDMTAY